MRCWETSPWISRYPIKQSKNSEEGRVAKVKDQRVSLAAGLGRPQDRGWNQLGRPVPGQLDPGGVGSGSVMPSLQDCSNLKPPLMFFFCHLPT